MKFEVLIFCFISLGAFLVVLTCLVRAIIDQQAKEQVELFLSQAKIPKSLRGLIKVTIKWK
tara:strand:- start:3057 stop:3239 length:183 start_codon:yes stop_codon:yes gene_type:complete